MNLLKAETEEDVQKIVDKIKSMMAGKAAFQPIMPEDKLEALKQQILEKVRESKEVIARYGLREKASDKILLSCVLRFYPKTSTFDVRFPMLKNLLPKKGNSKPILIKRPTINKHISVLLIYCNKQQMSRSIVMPSTKNSGQFEECTNQQEYISDLAKRRNINIEARDSIASTLCSETSPCLVTKKRLNKNIIKDLTNNLDEFLSEVPTHVQNKDKLVSTDTKDYNQLVEELFAFETTNEL